MPRYLLYTIYGLMILIGLVAMYSLLNTGNPDDMQFQIGDEVYINVAFGNNRKVNHVGFDPVLLKF